MVSPNRLPVSSTGGKQGRPLTRLDASGLGAGEMALPNPTLRRLASIGLSIASAKPTFSVGGPGGTARTCQSAREQGPHQASFEIRRAPVESQS